jgi:hypothetical protein
VPEQFVLNLALARSLHRLGFNSSEFEFLALQATWNTPAQARRAPTEATLTRVWAESQSAEHGAPSTPETPSLPDLLLSELPDTAWTEWASLYRSAVGNSTEAADEFHYLGLLTVLGTAFGRKLVVHCGRPVYPNIYAILVGPTGDRKTTAAHLALDLVPRIAPQALLINGVGSQEGLMERMATSSDQAPTLWYVDEMAALLKKARRESSGGLIEFVTEIFHCPDFKTHATRAKAIHLQRPTLNILAGSTPTWLEAALQEEDVLGGFVNRFVFVTGTPKPDNAIPRRPDVQALGQLAVWISQAAQGADRELAWDTSAKVLWSDFYLEWRRHSAALGEHVGALLRRIDLYIVKFAAISAAMDGTAAISRAHLSAAIDLGRFLAGCAYRLLGGLGESPDCRLERLIQTKLEGAQGTMRRKELRQAIGGRVSGEKLDRVLSAMERNGLIHQIQEPTRSSAKMVSLT